MKFKTWFIQENNIEDIIRTNIINLVMFFKKDNDIFGTDEEGRITFAKLKNPDEVTTNAWLKEASFMGINIKNKIENKPHQFLFFKKDLPKIKVIDKDEAIKELKKQIKKEDIRNTNIETDDSEEDIIYDKSI